MSSEALRAALYAVGATLVFVAGFDDMLVAASIPALGLIPAGIAKILMAVGTYAVGYARTAKTLGDVSIQDIIAGKLGEAVPPAVVPAAAAKAQHAERDTEPGLGGPKV